MILTEVEVRSWRGFSQELSGLSPRLNLILGPNESGKSRLVDAISFGLFESHKGSAQHKQLLQSWTSAESPFVRIAFTVNDTQYEIQKTFLKGSRAQLVGGGTTLRDDDAEEALQVLMGTKAGGVRGVRDEDLGIWPLLVVRQGESTVASTTKLNDETRGRLQEQLSKEIGVAAISEWGRKLVDLAREEYERFFTPEGREGVAVRTARSSASAADTSLAETATHYQQQEQIAAQLDEARSRWIELDSRYTSARGNADAAQIRAQAAQDASARVATAQGALNTAKERVTTAKQTLDRQIEFEASAQRLADEIAILDTDIGSRAQTETHLQRAVESSANNVALMENKVAEARIKLDVARSERRRKELTDQCAELQAKVRLLKKLESDAEGTRTLRSKLSEIDKQTLKKLRLLDQAVRTAKAELKGAAVQVVVKLRQSINVDGKRHNAGDRIQLDIVEDKTIAIGNVAEIRIRPGSGALESLRVEADSAGDKYAKALRAAGVLTIEEAAAMHESYVELSRTLDVLLREARAASSKPLPQIREDLARLQTELDRLGPRKKTSGSEEALTATVRRLEGKLADIRGERDAASSALTKHQADTLELGGRRDSKLQERVRLQRQLDGKPSSSALHEAHGTLVHARESAQRALAEAEREFNDLGGSEAQSDARRLTIAAETLASRLREARSEVDQLTGSLRSAMESGSYESLTQAEGHAQQAHDALSRLERQANAARQLWTTLSEERNRVIERLTTPVIQRVKPYLAEIFPGSTLDADDNLELAGLQSESFKEPFEALSAGAQEQLSLITRIGIAEVLSGSTRLPLILDDVLTNTDPIRIKQMHKALFRATHQLQILLFSCHDVLFDDLGADRVYTLRRLRR